jgi:glyoxylase-like metal-dependent hydrolase (beta-lactamase superfamily II)
VLHSHCHIDHAGKDDHFPLTTPVVMNRRELEHSASGLMGGQYPPEYVKHHIDRLHAPGALRLLDLELSGPDEIFEGIVCEAAGGHTEGSMNVLVETAQGTACICGDVIYDIQHQIVEPWHQVLADEPQTTGNHTMTKRSEKAAIKKALNRDFVLPLHDFPARVKGGRVVARLKHGCRVRSSTSPSSLPRWPRLGRRLRPPHVASAPTSTERSMGWNCPSTSASASRNRTSGTWQR